MNRLAAVAALLAWLFLALRPSRPWDFRPVAEDEPPPPEPEKWPSVCAVVPARDEVEVLPDTLPALLGQDYPGPLRVVLVDDRSADGTAELARRLAGGGLLQVVAGVELPPGWVGKLWAQEQGARAAGDAAFLLLTDADIRHAPGSLRRLVAESLAGGLALNSRMARLRCESAWERLLIPAFVYFFNLLYPMRRVNDLADPLAAAAGGCVLLSRRAYEEIGGFAPMRDAIIDDVRLAAEVKGRGLPVRLSLSRTDVVSLRRYDTLASLWQMVRRTAFTELRYSWPRLAGALGGLALLYAVPVAATAAGSARLARRQPAPALLPGAAALALMAATYRPAGRFFGLSPVHTLTLPLAALLYMGMTLDSALRYATGVRSAWRGRDYAAREVAS